MIKKSTCPFNWSGSKSIYNELFSITEPIADLFGGGGGFWSNIQSTDIIVNDSCIPLIKFQKRIYESTDSEFEKIIATIYDITLAIISKELYNKMREKYNETKDDILFMCCLSSCTNNLVRFNKSGGFNQTWGQRKFNKNMEEKLRVFRARIKLKQIKFSYGDFTNVDVSNRILFIDPPYLISNSSYNTSWTNNDDIRLYNFINGKNFIMTNYLTRGTLTNDILIQAIKTNNWIYKEIRTGKMKAQKDNSIFTEFLICDSEETINKCMKSQIII